MNADEWIRRAADRLAEQWRHLDREALEATAGELYAQEKWRRFAPEVAAVAWLRLGVLTA